MSTQTVVDVVISGSTTTVVDKRIDGVTTVAGAPPVTNVSGQIPDLGVDTDILATEGDILSLTNDVANLRANLIVTGTTLTDEIGVLSGHLISTGNNLEFQISTLSGNLIASGNNLDSLRDVLSGNLITTGQDLLNRITNSNTDISSLQTATGLLSSATGALQENKFNKAGGTISGSIIPNASGTLNLGSESKPFLSGHFKDLKVSNNTLFIGDVPIHSSNGGIDFSSATGVTEFQDVSIRNLTVTGTEVIIDVEHLGVKDNTIVINSGEQGAGITAGSGGIVIDRGTLPDADIIFNETNDNFEIDFPLSIEGSLAVKRSETGSFADDSDISSVTTNLIATGRNLQTQISNNDNDILTLTNNLNSTGQTLQVQIDSNDSDISTLTSNISTTGQTLQTQITSNDSDISSLTSNLVTTGQTLTTRLDQTVSNLATSGQILQTQITSNDSDIATLTSNLSNTGEALSGNLISTGNFLDAEIAIVSGLTTGVASDPALSGKVDDLSGNLITTGQTLTSEIAIVSGIATGRTDTSELSGKFNALSGNLITTGQTLTTDVNNVSSKADNISGNLIATGQTLQTQISSNDSDISTLTSNLSATGETLETDLGEAVSNLATTGQILQVQITSNDSDISSLTSNLITTGQTLTSEINTVSGLITDNDGDISDLKAATGVLKTSTDNNASNLISSGNFLDSEIAIVSGIAGGQDVTALSGKVDTLSGNLITTGQTLQTQITSNDSDISSLTSNLITTGQTLTSEIAIVSGLTTGSSSDPALSGKVDTLSGNLITTGQTLQTQITSNDSDISTLTSNLVTTGQTLTSEIAIVSGIAENASDEALSGKVDTLSGNLITTGQTLQTQITSNDSDITNLTSNLVTTGQTLTTDITTVSGLIVDNDGDITALKTATGVLKTSTDSNAANLITTGQTLQTQITSNDGDISTLTTNLGTTGQTLQTQITSNDSDISTLTSNLITTGQTLTTDISTVSGLITDNDADITALKSATGVLKTSTDANTTNLITTGQTLQTQITSNDGDITTLTSNLVTTGQTLQTQITSNDSDISTLTTNVGTTGQTLQTQITSNDSDISTLTSNLVTTGQTLTTNINTVATNLGTSGQTLQTQITSNDSDISTLTSNLGTTGQTLQTQITSNDSDIASLTTNLGTTGQTLQTQITSNDSDISTLDSTTVKLTTNQSIAGNKIFTNDVTINNLTVTGTEVVVDVENLAVKDNIIEINSGESGAGISRISGGIVIDRGTATNANILYNDANDRFELNFPLAVEGEVVASASNLITTGQTLTTNINTVSTNLGTSGQTLQTQITSNDSDISTLTTNLGTTGQTLQTQITSNDSDISTLTTNLGTTGQTLQTQITSNDSDISTLTTNLGTTGQTLQTQIASNDSDISTLTSNLVSTGSVVDDISGNLITTGQTLQTQITSNDSDITTLTSNLVTTGQTLTTNINTVSTNLISTGKVVDDVSGNLITTGQTLQTQITSNDTDITNLSSNLVTTGQTLTTNINTVATNLVTTGQTLTSEIATVSGLIPATVIDGSGTANKVPLWSDANTIGDSIISQSNYGIGIGTAYPSRNLHVYDSSAYTRIEATGGYSYLEMVATYSTYGSYIRFLGSSNTIRGTIYADSYSNLRLYGGSNSSTPLFLKSDGNVGVGQVAASYLLDVKKTSGTNVDVFAVRGATSAFLVQCSDLSAANPVWNLRTFSGEDLTLKPGNSEAVRIKADGAVGINTTSPNASSKLHVYGWTIIQSATNFASLRLQSTTGSWDIDNNDGTFGLQWAGGDKFNITSAGSVGIGTVTPVGLLMIRKDQTAPTRLIISNEGTVNASTSARLSFYEGTTEKNYIERRRDGSGDFAFVSPADDNPFVFENASGEFLTLVNSKVGIGTDNPARKLHVVGDYIRNESSAGSGVYSQMDGDGFTIYRSSANCYLNFPASGSSLVVRGPSYAEFIRVNSSGNVGIGTNNPRVKLHVVTSSVGTTPSTSLDDLVVENNGAGGITLINKNDSAAGIAFADDDQAIAGLISYNHNGNNLRFTTNGNTEAMRIDSSQQVGIGTNAPDTKLHIEGTTKTSATIESTGNHAELIIKSENNTYSPYVVFKDAGADRYFIQANPSDSLLFRPQGTGTTSNWIVFSSSGSLGIGTQTPGYKLDVNGTAHITTAQDSVAPLTLKSTYNGSTAGPLLDLYRKSGTPSDGDNLGTITFTADTNVGSINEFARIESTALDVTDTTEDGALKLAVVTAGTLRSRIYMDATETVLNDASQDFDFRVESDNSANALFVQGSSGNVGIGTNSPAHKLEVSGGGGGTFGAITNRQSANANTDGIATVNYNGGNNSLRLWVDASGNRYLNAGTTAVISFTTTAVDIKQATTFSSGRATFSGTAGADGVVLAGGESTSLSSRLFFDNGTAGQAVTILNNSGGMEFRTAGTPGSSSGGVRMYLNSVGNLGIGTGSPPHKLSIYGTGAGKATVQIEGEGGADPYINFLVNNTTHWAVGADDSASDSFKISQHSALGTNDRITVLSGGSVGIGVADPDQSLEVAGAIKSTGAYGFYAGRGDTTWSSFGSGVPTILLRGSLDNSRAGAIHFNEYDGNTTSAIYSTDGSDGYGFVMAAYQGDIKFATGSLTGNKMVILSGGNVGIGTNAPVTKLDIWGGTGTRPTDPFGGQNQLFISQGSTTNAGITISADNNGGTQICTFIQSNTSASAALIGTQSNHGARIRTNNTDRITIASGGAITFNSAFTFPTSDGSSGQTLQTDGSGNVTWSSAGTGTISGSGTDNYIPRFNGTTALENSAIYDNGSNRISLGTVTTSPWQALHVQSTGSQFSDGASGNNNYNVAILDQNAYTSNYAGGILFGGKYNNAGNITTLGIVSASKVNGDGIYGGKVHIGGRENGTANVPKVLTVTHANVGIGTDSPSARLHITSNGSHDEGAEIVLRHANNNSTDVVSTLSFQNNAGQVAMIQGGTTSGNTNGYISLFTDNSGTSGERMRIISDGNVGIGTASPAYPLDVRTAIQGAMQVKGAQTHGLLLGEAAYSTSALYTGLKTSYMTGTQDYMIISGTTTDGNTYISAKSGSNAHMRAGGNNSTNEIIVSASTGITYKSDVRHEFSTGNVGIGTAAPDNPLEVFGADSGIKISSASNNRPHLRLECGTAEKLRLSANTLYGAIGDSSDTNRYMVFKDGNIGIGTPTPTVGNLQLRNSSVSILALTRTNGSTTSDMGIIRFGNTDIDSNLANIIATHDGATDSAKLVFQTQATGAATADRLTIKSGGNVGIGTVDPDGRLHIYTGSAGSTTPNTNHDDLTIESSGNAGLQLFTPDTNYQYIAFGSPAGGANRGYVRYGHNEEEMVLRAASVDILKIKSTGVGIGTTPNSNAKLESYITSGGEKGLRLNSNFSGGNAVDFIPAVVGVSNAGFSIDLAGTTRFVINDGGNVGIGTNSALDKLDVYGSGAVFRNLSDNADSVQIVRGTNHTANPDAKFYIYDNSSADWAAKINLDGASYGLDITGGADYFFLCRKASGDHLFSVHGSHTTVNDAGIDYDFRVESNNDDYLLFTEGSTDRVAISTTAPAAKLHVEGDFKVGTTNNGNWMGYKDVSLNGTTYTTVLTINLANHTGCYVKLFLSGDWSSHSAVAFVGEYFVQNGSDGYAEPGTVISEFDNTNSDSIESKIVDPSSDTFTIQLKLSTAANGTLSGKLSYHVMGMATAVS